ncbi:MAG: NUDIX hydrolase [Ruminococcus sp.]|nr:NUDIX hydrolase [Ruminococcus sp.]
MPAFLKDITRFYGTGEKNKAGQSLEEFLENYDPYKYRTPSCTVDTVLFSCGTTLTKELREMQILLVKRSNHPSIGCWALPGGFVDLEENLEDAARRELREETGVEDLPMEQIATYGDYDRDPRTRVITTVYMALVQEQEPDVHAGDDAADALWCRVALEETDKKENRRNCRLHIWNREKGLDTCASVEHIWQKGLICHESFRVTEPGMIAVDHAAIIVQALTILQERCGR